MPTIHLKTLNLLFMLLVFVLVGAVLGSVIGLVAAVLITGNYDLGQILAVLENQTNDPSMLLIIQGFSSIGMFVLPPFALGLFQHRDAFYYVERRGKLSFRLLFLTFLMTLSFGPIAEWLGKINQLLVLPEQWSALEAWMKEMEQQMEQITLLLLSNMSFGGFVLNLIVIAVIAAVGEELLFRGCLQPIFIRWFKNPHVAIWVVAIIFSAIHMQFYGFLPRLALGVLFGYLFYWSGNIWIPILAHFVNNGTVLVNAYVYQLQGNELSSLTLDQEIPVYLYVGSVIVFAYAIWAFRIQTKSPLLQEQLDPIISK